MGVTEIVLLVLGIGIFVASFVIPARKEQLKEEERRRGGEQIRQLVEEQMKEAQSRIAEAVDETITYAVEKTERSMERITNEKIMAVNEYSNTVLEEIHKNHEEAVFLYDMLNDKHQNLKATAANAEKTAQEVKASVEETVRVVEESAKTAREIAGPEKDFAALRPLEMEKIPPEDALAVPVRNGYRPEPAGADRNKEAEKTEAPDALAAQPGPAQKAAIAAKKKAVKQEAAPSGTAESSVGDREIALSFAGSGRNKNEKILALHKAGKSNVAIAKELGLGIGEVKLVIDLFKGSR